MAGNSTSFEARRPVPRPAGKLAFLGGQIAALAGRHEWAFALAAALLWCAGSAWRSLRPFWFDELFTFHIARQPQLGQILGALPADGNPPLYYLLARLAMHLLGETEFAARLPALVGFLGASLAVYRYVRCRRPAVFALLGMLLLLSAPIASYGSEARPYALMLAFTGLTLVSWQAATAEIRTRALPLIGLAAGIAGAIASHHYGLIHVGVALLFGETVRILQRRRLDLRLYGAMAAGLSMLALTMPLALASRRVLFNFVQHSSVFWAKPGLAQILAYGSMVPLWFPLAFLLLIWATEAPGSERDLQQVTPVPAYEISAAIGLALTVPIMAGLTWFTTGYYLDRYAIGSALGIAILMSLWAPALAHAEKRAAAAAGLGIVLLYAGLAMQPLLWLARNEPAFRRADSAAPDSLLATAPGSEPIVIASAVEYLQDWWYAPPQLRARLRYLADVAFAVHEPDFLPELSLVTDQPYLPSKAEAYRRFVAAHRRFLIYSVGMPRLEWTLRRLKADSWSLRAVRREGDSTLYLAEAPP